MGPPCMKTRAGFFSPDLEFAGIKSWPWIFKPSEESKITCWGTAKRSEGKSLGQASGAKGATDFAAELLTVTRAGCVALEKKYAKCWPSLSIIGLHSIPSPRVHCCGRPPETSTRQRWRRSTSPQLELKRTDLRSGVRDHCSTSQFPGVRSCGAPPLAESAYKCCQPSCSEAMSRRLSAAH